MLDGKLALEVIDIVKNFCGIDITFEEVFTMQTISTTPYGSGHTVLSLQKGDVTILVWLCLQDNKITVWRAKNVVW